LEKKIQWTSFLNLYLC